MQEYEKIHNRLVRNTASECVVLLNYDGAFPLEKPCTVALYGHGARNTITGGTGSGEVNSREIINIEKGLTDTGFVITTTEWMNRLDEIKVEAHKQLIKDIKKAARKHHTLALLEAMNYSEKLCEYDIPIETFDADIAIYVVSRNAGEGLDRENVKGDIQLLDSEIRDILLLNEKYKNFILVLNVGNVIDLSPVKEVKNILLLSQLGALTGQIFADILLGKSIPTGRLATTWAAFNDYQTIGDFGDKDDTHYKEGIYFGYRYFDSENIQPIYPFGYGLNYSKLAFDKANIKKDNGKIIVETNLSNVGQKESKETLQLYVSKPYGKICQAYQDLVAFKKSDLLKPNESEKMQLAFRLNDISSFDESSGNYILEKGIYVLRLGFNSRDTKEIGSLQIDEDIITRLSYSRIDKCGFEDYKSKKRELTKVEPVIQINKEDIELIKPYDNNEIILEEVKQLSNKELALFATGGFDNKKGSKSNIGNASNIVPGAAGETSSYIRNYRPLIMADGPAGLRLAKQYFIRKGHKIPLQNNIVMMTLTMEMMPKFLQKLIGFGDRKPKPNEKIYEQYATAIPIATAVAQSFNLEIAEQYGIMVGDQMDRFNVDLWLAPALNIHRDIRCGRNFEYYSEDPLISGKFAAAITRGVQSHAKRGVTIKHFAANNQETNRYYNSSWISERVLRDIYLKGFEIAIRESNPKAVMSSYNLINGIHTSESRWLIHDILRKENNYQGMVMTDWIIIQFNKGKGHKKVEYDKVIASGHSLVMPGNKKVYKTILKALNKGKLSREEIEVNISHLVKLINN